MEKLTNKNLRLLTGLLYAVFLCHSILAAIVSFGLFGIFVLGICFPHDATAQLECLIGAICTIIYMIAVFFTNIDTIILLKDIFKNKENNHVKRRVISMITLLIIPYIAGGAFTLYRYIDDAQKSVYNMRISKQANEDLHRQAAENCQNIGGLCVSAPTDAVKGMGEVTQGKTVGETLINAQKVCAAYGMRVPTRSDCQKISDTLLEYKEKLDDNPDDETFLKLYGKQKYNQGWRGSYYTSSTDENGDVILFNILTKGDGHRDLYMDRLIQSKTNSTAYKRYWIYYSIDGTPYFHSLPKNYQNDPSIQTLCVKDVNRNNNIGSKRANPQDIIPEGDTFYEEKF